VSNVFGIKKALDDILEGKTYNLPKIPISYKISKMLKSDEVSPVMNKVHELLDIKSNNYVVNENNINRLGYAYLGHDEFEKAIAVFQLNVDYNSESSNVYDSLGEAQLAVGDTLQSIANYTKSVEINPNNQHGIETLKKLGADTSRFEKEIIVSEEILETYLGKFELMPEFIITITREGSQLKAQATGQPIFDVFPKSENIFYVKVVNAQLTFHKDDVGQVNSVTLLQGGREITGDRIEE